MVNLSSSLEECRKLVDNEVERYFSSSLNFGPGLSKLQESVRYSVLEGGKRFRPALSMFTASALDRTHSHVLAFALSVEFIHTYSLIHDDLPCMDDDEVRRGRPTNHKVFGEAIALLAGDALLTEAFYLIAKSYPSQAESAMRAIRELSESAGIMGMVGGQADDLLAQREKVSEDALMRLHEMKTGALIKASVVGAAHLCDASPTQLESLTDYAKSLGLAFQVADDILDYHEQEELGNYCALLGVGGARELLDELSESALSHLSGWSERAELLREVVRFNHSRKA